MRPSWHHQAGLCSYWLEPSWVAHLPFHGIAKPGCVPPSVSLIGFSQPGLVTIVFTNGTAGCLSPLGCPLGSPSRAAPPPLPEGVTRARLRIPGSVIEPSCVHRFPVSGRTRPGCVTACTTGGHTEPGVVTICCASGVIGGIYKPGSMTKVHPSVSPSQPCPLQHRLRQFALYCHTPDLCMCVATM